MIKISYERESISRLKIMGTSWDESQKGDGKQNSGSKGLKRVNIISYSFIVPAPLPSVFLKNLVLFKKKKKTCFFLNKKTLLKKKGQNVFFFQNHLFSR